MFHVKHSPAIQFSVPGDAFEPLKAIAELLLDWNARINLIARRDQANLWHRHILDSAQLSPLLPDTAGEIIDLGSGAGFPGLVLAIMTSRHVHLVEPDQRKCAFLREAVRISGASAEVHPVRAEQLHLTPVAIVTARALAPLPRLLALAAPLLAPGGFCLFPKGRTVEDELTAARREWHMRVERFPSRTSETATILRLREIARVPPTC
jgi:16S rRNA (guanine(527)-N(7))-methyltransferase RsmG